MTLKLTTPLRREVEIDGETFTVIISSEGVRISRKRFRGGRSLSWGALWSQGGDAAEGPRVEDSMP